MSKEGSLRFDIDKRDLEKLLRNHAPEEPARDQLTQLILELQLALQRGLPLIVQANAAERRARLDQLLQLETAFRTTIRLLGRRTGSARSAVGDILGAELARLLADQAFADAGFSVDVPSGRELSIIRSRAREPELAVADELRGRRAKLSPQSATVLASLLARFRALLAAQLAIERGHKGGRPSHPKREYILARLATSFKNIFGVPPTSSETGTFVSVASEILELFGLETLGVESAAKRLLTKMRRPAGSRPKRRK